jgi:glycosyltransferase involved in cell wall biosynthesis
VTAPLVSVVLPTYNRLAMLLEAIASVEAQTFGDWELIVVVDEGSGDGTAAALSAWPDQRLRALVMPHTDRPARARNAGLAVARGSWIAFLDDDDLWHPRKLETQLRELARSPACRWSHTAFERVDAAGHRLASALMSRPLPAGDVLDSLFGMKAVIATPTVLVDANLVAECGGFDESLPTVEDYDLWFRLAARSPLHAVPHVLTTVRVAAGRKPDAAAAAASWLRILSKVEPRGTAGRFRRAWTRARLRLALARAGTA